ncbi:MAG: glutamate synthase-related protein [Syntrophotaleaceae bacterium]
MGDWRRPPPRHQVRRPAGGDRVRLAHRALAEAGLRHKVEIWADGGMHSGRDVIKMLLLGANRVGFGTLPMVVIGCTTVALAISAPATSASPPS